MNREFYMRRCLQISRLGIGTTRPNPAVGAVVVVGDKIVGEGFTSQYGGNHAEVNAIHAVKDQTVFKKATLYVTLEPCSHYGKTPPCTDLIIKSGIKKVVVGTLDSNRLVSGRGIRRLRNAGCEVTVGMLEKECREHHRRFFTFHDKKRPFIILKWAETSDGFIAPKNRKEQNPIWITLSSTRQLVHKWRSEEHAILVGTTTVLHDNPRLDVRRWKGLNPVRVILDRTLKIPTNLRVHDTSVKTIFINEKSSFMKGTIFFEKINFSEPIGSQICQLLFKHKIQSLLIEGGAKTLATFISEGLWDEARVFKNEKKFYEGIKAPQFNFKCLEEKNTNGDSLTIYRND